MHALPDGTREAVPEGNTVGSLEDSTGGNLDVPGGTSAAYTALGTGSIRSFEVGEIDSPSGVVGLEGHFPLR